MNYYWQSQHIPILLRETDVPIEQSQFKKRMDVEKVREPRTKQEW